MKLNIMSTNAVQEYLERTSAFPRISELPRPPPPLVQPPFLFFSVLSLRHSRLYFQFLSQ